jgi:methyl-accepting chemotaxis protein
LPEFNVSDWFGSHVFTVGIVGGGRGGSGLAQFFGHSQVAKVIFLVDADPEAPGMILAREAGIRTFTDALEAIRTDRPDFIFDATGDEALDVKIRELIKSTETRLISPATSRMMVRVLEENRTRVREDVSQVVSTIKHELSDSLEGSRNLVSRINSIMSSMQMLALNASIEAAKAGVHGRGFAVVADHMGKSVEAVRKLTQEIDGVNANIIQVSEQIDSVLEKLK